MYRVLKEHAVLRLLMCAAGLALCALALLFPDVKEALDRFWQCFKPFPISESDGALSSVFPWIHESACLCLITLGVIIHFFAAYQPAGTIFSCMAAFCVLSITRDIQLPWLLALFITLAAGMVIGGLRGFLMPKKKRACFLSGIMLDLIAVFTLPLFHSRTESIFQVPLLSPQGLTISSPTALICVLACMLLFRSGAGMTVKSALFQRQDAERASQGRLAVAMAISDTFIFLGAGLLGLMGVSGDVYYCIELGIRSFASACLSLFNPFGALLSSMGVQFIVNSSARLADHPAAAVLPELFFITSHI